MSIKMKYSKSIEGLWIFLILISGIIASCNQKKVVPVNAFKHNHGHAKVTLTGTRWGTSFTLQEKA